DGHRYDDYAGRVLVDYAIPIWRQHGFVYGGDAFAAVGITGQASSGDLSPPGGLTWRTLPIDLTGDLGLRLDTYIGLFTISIATALRAVSFGCPAAAARPPPSPSPRCRRRARPRARRRAIRSRGAPPGSASRAGSSS